MYEQIGLPENELLGRRQHPVFNILDNYTDLECVQRFRFNKLRIRELSELFHEELVHDRLNGLSVTEQLLMSLRFCASGSFLQIIGDTANVSKSTVSETVARVSRIISARIDEFVNFQPNYREEANNMQRIAGMRGVVALVDGTHIRIQAPSHFEEHNFVNRHGFHSINTQIMCTSDSRIVDVVARWPGSVHDSRMFQLSNVGIAFANGQRLGIILGDSGYRNFPYLLTPFAAPQNHIQRAYNRAQTRTRSIVERTIGQLKRRFHVLHGEIRMRPERACRIIGACCALHNLALRWNLPIVGGNLDIEEPDEPPEPEEGQAGLNYRLQYCNEVFANAPLDDNH